MKGMNKINILKEILGDKDLVKKRILKEEPEVEGILTVEAEGDSPDEAKDTILKQLNNMDLPDEEEMEDMEECEDEECDEYRDEEEDEEEMELDEDMLDEEDKDILELLPEGSREQFKKKLLEKIKNM